MSHWTLEISSNEKTGRSIVAPDGPLSSQRTWLQSDCGEVFLRKWRETNRHPGESRNLSDATKFKTGRTVHNRSRDEWRSTCRQTLIKTCHDKHLGVYVCVIMYLCALRLQHWLIFHLFYFLGILAKTAGTKCMWNYCSSQKQSARCHVGTLCCKECMTYCASVTVRKATGLKASWFRGSTHLVVLMRFRYIVTIPTRPLLLNIYMLTKWLSHTYWIMHIAASHRHKSACVCAFLFEPVLP